MCDPVLYARRIVHTVHYFVRFVDCTTYSTKQWHLHVINCVWLVHVTRVCIIKRGGRLLQRGSHHDNQSRIMKLSLLRTFASGSEVPVTFAPRNFHSLELSFHGTFACMGKMRTCGLANG